MATSVDSTPIKIGFFGGSFDPFHRGHLEMALRAIKLEKFDRILLCPAHHAPLRKQKPLFSADDRLAMVQSICKIHPGLFPYSYEIDQERTCFTHETITKVQETFPGSSLYVLLGTDQFQQLEEWRHITELSKFVNFLVLARGTYNLSAPKVPGLNFSLMNNPIIDLSSTKIRDRFLAGKSVREFLPAPIHTYLNSHSLYKDSIS